MYPCKTAIPCVIHLSLSEKLASIHELILLISAGMSQLLPFPLHLDVSRKEIPFVFTEFIKTFFSLSAFSQRFGSGPPSSVPRKRELRDIHIVFNVILTIWFPSKVVNLKYILCSKSILSLLVLILFFKLSTLRIWFFKMVNVNYIPCSKSIFSLLVFSICLMLILRIGFFLNTIPLFFPLRFRSFLH